MNRFKRTGKILITVVFWIGVWALISAAVNKDLLLPSPGTVFFRLFELAKTEEFWRTTAFSLLRIFIGTVSAVSIGLITALITSKVKFLYTVISPFLSVVRSTPVASFIILALIWMGRELVPVFVSFLMVMPVVFENVSTGIVSTDKNLLQMAYIYNMPFARKLRRIYIPSVMPYFLSSVRTSIGLAWKAGIAAEVLTVPINSIGKKIYESKMYLEIDDLFAWTLAVIILSLIIEKLFVLLFKKTEKKYNVGEWQKND